MYFEIISVIRVKRPSLDSNVSGDTERNTWPSISSAERERERERGSGGRET